MSKKDPVGSVLVAGGGITGMQAALDLADSGYYVYLVERSPTIGGKMAQLDKTFPTLDCSQCILTPKMSEAGQHENITLLTLYSGSGYLSLWDCYASRTPSGAAFQIEEDGTIPGGIDIAEYIAGLIERLGLGEALAEKEYVPD